MVREFSTNYDPDRLEGGDFPAPGEYHVEVNKVDEDSVSKSKGTPQMEVTFEILAGTTADQEGKEQRVYFSWSGEAEHFALGFAVAVGLTTTEELKSLKAAGKPPRIDFSQAVGRQCCLAIIEDTYEGKTRNKVEPWSIWHLNNPRTKNIAKNAGKLAELGQPTNTPAEDDNPFV